MYIADHVFTQRDDTIQRKSKFDGRVRIGIVRHNSASDECEPKDIVQSKISHFVEM